MAIDRAERRLAAILAADVVGYSRLVEQDEAATLAALRELRREVLDPLLAEHRGRVVKLMGDGVLAEFGSAVDAVACAAALQRAVTERQAGVPAERRIVLRIGVNLGEVVVEEDGDLLGDGVNVAARLEGAAGPGEVYLSGKVHDEVRGKLDLGFEDRGELALKNIARPVRVWRVAGAALALHPTDAAPSRPTVAVLPFADASGDPAQRFFSDGLTEDLITELSRFHQLTVLSASSSSRFPGAADAQAAGRELGAQYVVEGGVRRLGGRVRITARLVDAASGGRLWAERFDRDQEEIFAIQDELVRTIVATLAGRVRAAGAERAKRKPPASLAAYECVLRGKVLPVGDAEAEAEARRLYERAIELDPDYALAHAMLAYALSIEWFRDMTASGATLDRALGLARRAVTLDENDPLCQTMLGWIYLNRGSFDLAERYYERALELNPNDAEQLAYMGVLHTYLGDPDGAVGWYGRARLLDRHFEPSWYWPMLGVAHFTARRYDEASAALHRSPTMPVWVRAYLAACHALAGRADRARKFAADVVRSAPGFSSARLVGKEPFKRPADREVLLEGLREAGLP